MNNAFVRKWDYWKRLKHWRQLERDKDRTFGRYKSLTKHIACFSWFVPQPSFSSFHRQMIVRWNVAFALSIKPLKGCKQLSVIITFVYHAGQVQRPAIHTNFSLKVDVLFMFNWIILPCGFIGYARTAINDGPGCLSLRCPSPNCKAAVGEKIILPLVSEEDKMKYMRYILRSYVEVNRKVRIVLSYLCWTLFRDLD